MTPKEPKDEKMQHLMKIIEDYRQNVSEIKRCIVKQRLPKIGDSNPFSDHDALAGAIEQSTDEQVAGFILHLYDQIDKNEYDAGFEDGYEEAKDDIEE